MIQGVLFDMDGVLFDTEALSVRLTQEVAQEDGLDIPYELLCSLMGASHEAYMEKMGRHLGPDVDLEQHYAKVKERFMQYLETNGPPKMKGMESLLCYLKQHNIPAAIASSTKIAQVRKNVQDAGVEEYFTTLVGGDMVANYKPHPEIFQTAAAALGLAPSACLAIEDSHNGLRSASAAGCVTVMVPDMTAPTPEMRALCTAVLDSLEDIPAFIEEYNKNNPAPQE